MSTQINVIVDQGGLSAKAKQQTQANRWAKLEADSQKKVGGLAEEKRAADLAALGRDTDSKPLYGAKAGKRFRPDDIAGNRRLGVIRLLFLPPTELISQPAALPPDVDPETVRRWWRTQSNGFNISPVGLEVHAGIEYAYENNPLFTITGSRLTIDTSSVVLPPNASPETFTRASAVMNWGGVTWPFKTKDLSIYATVVAPTAGQQLVSSNGAVLARSEAASGVSFGFGGDFFSVTAFNYSGSNAAALVTFLGQQVYLADIDAGAVVAASCVVRGGWATINVNGTETIVLADVELGSALPLAAGSTASSRRFYLVGENNVRVPFLSVPSSAGSFGDIRIEAKG